MVQYVEKVLGYNRLAIKRDQEPALVTLKDKVRALGQFDPIEDAAPTGDSQSQGDAEFAVDSAKHGPITEVSSRSEDWSRSA